LVMEFLEGANMKTSEAFKGLLYLATVVIGYASKKRQP
jgi:hypothetical protein